MRAFLDRSELINVLTGFNPWWSAREWSAHPFHRLAFDACRRYLKDTSLRRAVLLSGPRRVGKTTVLQQMARVLVQDGDDPRSILYLSLDHPLLKLLTLREILALFHESTHPDGQPATLLLDEIQYAQEWETEVKLLIDHQPQYRILATGSVSWSTGTVWRKAASAAGSPCRSRRFLSSSLSAFETSSPRGSILNYGSAAFFRFQPAI